MLYKVFKEKFELSFKYFEMYENIFMRQMCNMNYFYKCCLKLSTKCFKDYLGLGV
jgi:hypothetical protein